MLIRNTRIESFIDFKQNGLVGKPPQKITRPIRKLEVIATRKREEPKLFEFKVYNRSVADNIIFVR